MEHCGLSGRMHRALSVDVAITARGGAQDRLSNPCDGSLRGAWPQQLPAATVGSCLDTGLCLARGHGLGMMLRGSEEPLRGLRG